MLEALISSKTRIKLLLKLFLNPENSAHLRGLADEFKESTNAVRIELNRLEEARLIHSETRGNKKLYKANNAHPLYKDINNILLKYIGADKIIEFVIKKIGNVEKVYLAGDYAQGKDSGIIDIILVGDVNKTFVATMVEKAEKLITKKIKYLSYSGEEWGATGMSEINSKKIILLWEANQ